MILRLIRRLVRNRCLLTDHTENDGQIIYGIPLDPHSVDDGCLREGFICLRQKRCKYCGAYIRSEPVESTDETWQEYSDWFEGVHGIRP